VLHIKLTIAQVAGRQWTWIIHIYFVGGQVEIRGRWSGTYGGHSVQKLIVL